MNKQTHLHTYRQTNTEYRTSANVRFKTQHTLARYPVQRNKVTKRKKKAEKKRTKERISRSLIFIWTTLLVFLLLLLLLFCVLMQEERVRSKFTLELSVQIIIKIEEEKSTYIIPS